MLTTPSGRGSREPGHREEAGSVQTRGGGPIADGVRRRVLGERRALERKPAGGKRVPDQLDVLDTWTALTIGATDVPSLSIQNCEPAVPQPAFRARARREVLLPCSMPRRLHHGDRRKMSRRCEAVQRTLSYRAGAASRLITPNLEDDVGQRREEHRRRCEEHSHPELVAVNADPGFPQDRGVHHVGGGGRVRHRSNLPAVPCQWRA